MSAMTGTASTAAATLRNTTVSCAVRWGTRHRLGAVGRVRRRRATGATLAWPPLGGQTARRAQRVDPGRRPVARADAPPAVAGQGRGEPARRAVPPVRGRREATHLEERDRPEDRRRGVAGRDGELVDRTVARDESGRDLPGRLTELDQLGAHRREPGDRLTPGR